MNPIEPKPITLLQAAAEGDSKSVEQLLDDGRAVNKFDDSALRAALRHKHPNVVKQLLAAGADFKNHATEFLCIAARNADLASLGLLLPLLKRSDGLPTSPGIIEPALLKAIATLDTRAVKMSLAAMITPVASNSQAVILAVRHGSVEILKILRDKGSDLFAEKLPALRTASEGRQPHVVKFLLSEGTFTDEALSEAVCAAVECGDVETLELLLEHGGQLEPPNAIVNAAINDSLDVLLLLEHYGNSFSPFANELVEYAIDQKAPKVLQWVLSKASVSNLILDKGLETAVLNNGSEILELLIQAGADAGANHSASLKIAIANGGFHMVLALLAAKAKPSDLDGEPVRTVLDCQQWWLLPELFYRGISVAGLVLLEDHAVNFFLHFPSAAMAKDNAGNSHPDSLLHERVKFAKTTAEVAGNHQPETKTTIAICLAGFLALLPQNLAYPNFGPRRRPTE